MAKENPQTAKSTSPSPVARRAGLARDEKIRKALTVTPQPPTDPIEHFRKISCEEGHSNWDEKDVKYSIDHRAWVIRCVDCDDYYVIPAGSPKPMELPPGMVPA